MNKVSLLSEALSNKVRQHEANARDIYRVTRAALGRGILHGGSFRINDGYFSDAKGEKWIVNALARGRGRRGDAIAVRDALRLIQYVSWPDIDRTKPWSRSLDLPEMQQLDRFFRGARALQMLVAPPSPRKRPKGLPGMSYPLRSELAEYLALELTEIATWYALKILKCPRKMGIEFVNKVKTLRNEYECLILKSLSPLRAEIGERGDVSYEPPNGPRRKLVLSSFPPQGDAIYIGEDWDDEQEERESSLKAKLQLLIDAQAKRQHRKRSTRT